MVGRIVCFILLTGTLDARTAESWPQARGPRLDGVVRGSAAFRQPFDLERAWSRTLGAGYSGISIAQGLAVTMFSDGSSDFVGAFDVASGEQRWRHRIGDSYPGRHGSEDGPSSTPCIGAGRVFATSPNGRLLAVSLADGSPLWSIDLVEAHGVGVPWYGFGASPVLVDDVLFVPFGTRNGRAGAAFDPATGRLLWVLPGGWVDYQHPVHLEGVEGVVAFDVAELRLFDVRTGEVRLEARHRRPGRDLAYPLAAPAGPKRLLLAYEDDVALFELDPASEIPFREFWRTRELRDSYATPVLHDGAVYGLSGIFLVCLDAETGQRLWKSREPGTRSLTLVDGHLVILATDGDLVVVEASSDGYAEKARIHATERGGYTPPSFAGGRVFVRNTTELAAVEVVAAPGTEEAGQDEVRLPAGELGRVVRRAQKSDDPDTVIDAWWRRQPTMPWIEDGRVHFLYRGPARDVALIGDMTEDRNVPETMERLPGTDLFHRSYPAPPGGRWQYAFLVDLGTVVTDPKNPRQAPSIMAIAGNPRALGYPEPEVESVVELPGWSGAPHAAPLAGPAGRLERIPFEGGDGRETRELAVYLPAAYDDDPERHFPTLYVLGGHGWLEHASAGRLLDGSMGRQYAEAIAVFVPFNSGSRDRLGTGGYVRMVAEEVLPLIHRRYRAGTRRVVLGAAGDAATAIALALADPEGFTAFASLSPYSDVEDLRLLRSLEATPTAGFLEWSRYEPRVLDENADALRMAAEIREILLDKGVTLYGGEVTAGPGWESWAARLAPILAELLPPDSGSTPDRRAADRGGS